MNLFDFFNFFSHAHNKRRQTDAALYTRIAENGADKVLSSEEENPSVHKTYVNFPTSRKSALDVPLYAISSGRSMVEMLGVLAIIGVLSIGAISGYSKAMLKYKLNKQTEQLTYLLNGSWQILNRGEFRIEDANHNTIVLTNILNKLDLIPKEMTIDDKGYLYDPFNNKVLIAWEGDSSGGFFKISIDINDAESCQNIWNFSKELHNILWQTHYYTTDDADSGSFFSRTYGDAYCSSEKPCLKDLNVAQIHNFCENCLKGNSCTIRVLWK